MNMLPTSYRFHFQAYIHLHKLKENMKIRDRVY